MGARVLIKGNWYKAERLRGLEIDGGVRQELATGIGPPCHGEAAALGAPSGPLDVVKFACREIG
jgi:hypothetical protein